MFKTTFHKLEKAFPALGRILRRVFLGEQISGLRQKIHGSGNLLKAKNVQFSAAEIDIIGDDNTIQIGEGSYLNNLKIRIRGSAHRIELGSKCRIVRGGVFWIEDDHCSIEIGSGTTMVEASIAVTEPGSKVRIGKDCMLANDIDIRVGDSHSVIEAASGRRINFAKDISIGDHVWVAAHTVILKGVTIGENSVVASGAIVTNSCEPGAILAGNPARVIKTGINWMRERLPKSE